MRKFIFNKVMWILLKMRICDKVFIYSNSGKSFPAYVDKGDYP